MKLRVPSLWCTSFIFNFVNASGGKFGLLYIDLYNDLINYDFPLPEGPNNIILHLLIIEEDEEVKNIDCSVNNL